MNVWFESLRARIRKHMLMVKMVFVLKVLIKYVQVILRHKPCFLLN